MNQLHKLAVSNIESTTQVVQMFKDVEPTLEVKEKMLELKNVLLDFCECESLQNDGEEDNEVKKAVLASVPYLESVEMDTMKLDGCYERVSDKMLQRFVDFLDKCESAHDKDLSTQDKQLLQHASSRAGNSRLGKRKRDSFIKAGKEHLANSKEDSLKDIMSKVFVLTKPNHLKKKIQQQLVARDLFTLWFTCPDIHKYALQFQEEIFPSDGIHIELILSFLKSLLDGKSYRGNNVIPVYKRETARHIINNLDRYCHLTGRKGFRDVYNRELKDYYQSLKISYSHVVDKAAPISMKEEYLLYLLIDFQCPVAHRFWTIHLLMTNSGMRYSSVRVAKGRHVSFYFKKLDGYEDNVVVHLQFVLDSVKTANSGSSRGKSDEILPSWGANIPGVVQRKLCCFIFVRRIGLDVLTETCYKTHQTLYVFP